MRCYFTTPRRREWLDACRPWVQRFDRLHGHGCQRAGKREVLPRDAQRSRGASRLPVGGWTSMNSTTNEAPRRRPGRPEKPITRGELQAVARACFADGGFDGVSMADIAGRAGLQKSSLFHHFSTKNELYRAVMQEVFGEITERIVEQIDAEGEFLARFDALSVALVRFFGDTPTSAKLLLRELMQPDAIVREAADALDTVVMGAVALLEEGMSSGVIPRQDTRHLVATLAAFHVTYFATPMVGDRLFEGGIFSRENIEQRALAVRTHSRRLVGAPVS